MNIQTILEKCREYPEITVTGRDNSFLLCLNSKEGTGCMNFVPLFPGITLAFIEIDASRWPAPDLSKSSGIPPLLINYCIAGRCELLLNNESYVYITDNQLSLSQCYARKDYIYPGHFYRGIEFFLDFDVFETEGTFLQDYFALDLEKLSSLYCAEGKTYLAKAPADVAALLNSLLSKQEDFSPSALAFLRLQSLSLLNRLSDSGSMPAYRPCTFYTNTQVSIAKQAEKILTADFGTRYSAKELAARFSISESSLKNYFRGVFGQNISEYMTKLRMEKAALLLTSTNLSVLEIGSQVGYSNQSKFAAVFKKFYHMSPLQYRHLLPETAPEEP